MTQPGDLSNANEVTFDTGKAKILPESGEISQAGVAGRFNLIGIYIPSVFPAKPGLNTSVIPLGGLGIGTPWIASASISETYADGTPHVGAANFYVQSVELDQKGNFVQIIFNLAWNWPLPAAVMMIIGYT